MIRSCFLELLRNNTGSLEDGGVVAREQEEDCGQELLRKNLVSKWMCHVETEVKSCRV